MRTHKEIIDEIGYSVLAAELKAKYHTMAAWKSRNSIPPQHWHKIVRIAASRGIPITFDDLDCS